MIKLALSVLLVFIHSVFAYCQNILIDSIITQTSLQQTVHFLSHDSLQGRFTGTPGAVKAAKFIASQFDSIGLKPINTNNYYNNFDINYEGKKMNGTNVIAMLPAAIKNDTAIIISAHYDHVGKEDDVVSNAGYTKKDNIFNGANDNATGVAAMLELAKYYAAKKDNRYNILFVAFAGEELGMKGSTVMAEQVNPKLIKAVINLEMLGRSLHNHCFIVANNNKVQKNLNQYLKNKSTSTKNNFFKNNPYSDENLFERSDHYPFTKKIKNAFTIMATSPKDEYYHSVDDEYHTINFDFLHTATKNIAIASEFFMQ